MEKNFDSMAAKGASFPRVAIPARWTFPSFIKRRIIFISSPRAICSFVPPWSWRSGRESRRRLRRLCSISPLRRFSSSWPRGSSPFSRNWAHLVPTMTPGILVMPNLPMRSSATPYPRAVSM